MVEERINQALAEHQAAIEDWRYADLARDLHVWAKRMVVEFKLKIGVPALAIEQLKRMTAGHYRPGRNGFGLRDEIAIDVRHVREDPYAEVLATLLHELLHAWQEHHGRSSNGNYHNKQFRDKAVSLGLIIDEWGYERHAEPPTPFSKLLTKHGVQNPAIPNPNATRRRRGVSKLKLWMCPCAVKVRVGRSVFNVQCLDCGGRFTIQSQ